MKRFWNMEPNPEAPQDGELNIDGVLVAGDDWFSNGTVRAKDFRKELAKFRNVTVNINSPGGDVMAGAELYSALREHSQSGKGKVTVKVTVLAASAASVVAMAGDEVLISPVAYMMIHNPWSVTSGNADELRHEADILDEIAEGIINAYAIKTGKSRAKLREMMKAESYMNGVRCVKEGFADGLLYASKPEEEEEAKPEEEEKEPDEEEDEGVLMRAGDFSMRAAALKAEAHGMKLSAWRTSHFADTSKANEDELEREVREDIARRASMISALF